MKLIRNCNQLDELLNIVKTFQFTHVDKLVITAEKGQLKGLINSNMRQSLWPHPKSIERKYYIIYKQGGDLGESGAILLTNLAKHTKILYSGINKTIGYWNNNICLEKIKVEFSNKQIQKYKKRNYIIAQGTYEDKKYQNIKNGQIVNELKYIKLVLNDIDNSLSFEEQIKISINDCIEKEFFITNNINEIYSKFNITEIEFNIFYNNKTIFESFYNSISINRYKTSTYFWLNNSSELYSYNVTAKNENRTTNLDTDLYKIELRIKRSFIYDLLKKNNYRYLKELSNDELIEWLMNWLNTSKNIKDTLSQKVFKTVSTSFRQERMYFFITQRLNNKYHTAKI